MELTIENLKNLKCRRIAIFNRTNLVDIIEKDLEVAYESSPYHIIDSDETYGEQAICAWYPEHFIYDADTIQNPGI